MEPKTASFFIVYITGLEAETSISCPSEDVADRVFKACQLILIEDDMEHEKVIMIRPGEEIPPLVHQHVVFEVTNDAH